MPNTYMICDMTNRCKYIFSYSLHYTHLLLLACQAPQTAVKRQARMR